MVEKWNNLNISYDWNLWYFKINNISRLFPSGVLEELSISDLSASTDWVNFSIPRFDCAFLQFHRLIFDGPKVTHNILWMTYQELSKLWKFSLVIPESTSPNTFYPPLLFFLFSIFLKAVLVIFLQFFIKISFSTLCYSSNQLKSQQPK